MRFFRHLAGLLKDLVGFARKHKAWWIVPLVVVMLLLAVAIVASKAVAPFIYTLF